MSVIYIIHKGIVFASTYTHKCVIVKALVHWGIPALLARRKAKQITIGYPTKKKMHLGSLQYIRGAGFHGAGG